jgi:hypothetical protein
VPTETLLAARSAPAAAPQLGVGVQSEQRCERPALGALPCRRPQRRRSLSLLRAQAASGGQQRSYHSPAGGGTRSGTRDRVFKGDLFHMSGSWQGRQHGINMREFEAAS